MKTRGAAPVGPFLIIVGCLAVIAAGGLVRIDAQKSPDVTVADGLAATVLLEG